MAIVVSPEEPEGTALLLEPSDNPIAKPYQEALYQAGLPVIVFVVNDLHKRIRAAEAAGRGVPAGTDENGMGYASGVGRHLWQLHPIAPGLRCCFPSPPRQQGFFTQPLLARRAGWEITFESALSRDIQGGRKCTSRCFVRGRWAGGISCASGCSAWQGWGWLTSCGCGPSLIEDLYERGLDKRVLLVVTGEFGRTPRINSTVGQFTKVMQPGRDHWPSAMSILVSGGGMRMGQVIGSTTTRGEYPKDRPLHPADLLATIYRFLGIDPRREYLDHTGRPLAILPDGQPLAELLG